MTAEELKNIFENPYDQKSWITVLKDVLGIKNILIKPQEVDTTTNEWDAKGFELGNFETIEGRLVGVYEVKLSDNLKLERNKVGLRNLLKPIYNNDVDAALVVFNQGSQWRFSYVSEISVRNKETGKREKKSTDLKRYTYLFGKGRKCRTAAERFTKIHQHYNLFGGAVKLDEIEKAFSVDSLTKDFYRELSDWYFRALKDVQYPDDAERAINARLSKEEREKEDNTRNATNTIRLITRLIFVWFLKQKGLVPDELFKKEEIDKLINYKDKTGSTYYKAILQNLFFATLNTQMGDENRKFIDRQFGIQGYYRYKRFFKDSEKFLALTKEIPFLNGGLFENLDKNVGKDNEIRIDCFSNALKNETRLMVPDSLFFDEETLDLSDIYHDKKKKNQKVRGLVNILQSYNFTIEENTPFEIEVALDPELLGKVFENLLASYVPETEMTARKMTGSFYTPREIVDYMVDESLKNYLQTKLIIAFPAITSEVALWDERLNHLFTYSIENHKFSKQEAELLVHALDEAKILDPACGSGAFPMGVLLKMVLLLNKLDEDNRLWKELQEKKALKDTEEAYKMGNKEERDARLLDISEAFDDNSSDYGRKLYLIENCIYGVDIQPIAVQIAKLRFFISLICDQEVSKGKKNYGVRPLPNLETKFVAANTLIGLNKPKQLLLRNLEIEKLEKELNDVRHMHFSAPTPGKKERCRKRDYELREQISELLKGDGWDKSTAEKIAHWNPYDQNASASFYDNEWMFGIIYGFDIILGNPPYRIMTKNNTNSNELKYFLENYISIKKSYSKNLFTLFIEKSITLLGKKSVLSFIVPEGLFKTRSYSGCVDLIQEKGFVKSIVTFSDYVFENAVTGNLIFVFLKNQIGETNHLHFNESLELFNTEQIENSILEKIKKSTTPLSAIATSFKGMVVKDRELYISENSKGKNDIFLLGKNISKWRINSMMYANYDELEIIGGTKRIEKHNYYPRILIRRTGDTLCCAFLTEKALTESTLYSCWSITPEISNKFLIALLNSKVLDYYNKELFITNQQGFPQILMTDLELLPIKKGSDELMKAAEKIVDFILIKQQPFFENLLNAIIYELYFPDELKSSGCNVVMHLKNLPDINKYKNELEKLNIIQDELNFLSDKDHPVRIALFNLDTIEEIAIIERKKK